jgi:hypothetical protein
MTNTTHDIIVGGVRFTLGLPGEAPPVVLTWHDHGISFAPGEGYNKVRRHAIDLAVWHWTGGEGEPPDVAHVLKQRGYGVEFAISTTGVIYQFVDPLLVDTADAAGVNARSVGTEIVSYGMRVGGSTWKPPHGGERRGTSTTSIHGQAVVVADFFAVQITAARALADGLSRALHIPRRVPTLAQVVVQHALAQAELDAFSGHIGHYQITRQKCDPGPAFMRELKDLFDPPPQDAIV